MLSLFIKAHYFLLPGDTFKKMMTGALWREKKVISGDFLIDSMRTRPPPEAPLSLAGAAGRMKNN